MLELQSGKLSNGMNDNDAGRQASDYRGLEKHNQQLEVSAMMTDDVVLEVL